MTDRNVHYQKSASARQTSLQNVGCKTYPLLLVRNGACKTCLAAAIIVASNLVLVTTR